MSTQSCLSLVTLPVEVVYHILDRLDTKDILFSFRNVCKRFNQITRTYNRYKIQFNCTSSNAKIRQICRIIKPENIASFSLTNKYTKSDQIGLIFSLIDIQQLTRICSLDIFGFDLCYPEQILHSIMTIPTLTSLSLRTTNSNGTNNLQRTIIAMSNLQKLYLSTIFHNIYEISWPYLYKLEQLTIDHCTHKQLCDILQHLPNLRTFSSNDYVMERNNQIILPNSLQRLTSLRLRSSNMQIDQLESLLSLTPSLVDLHIVNYLTLTDYFLERLSQWEEFICHKLPLLKKFKFFVHIQNYLYENIENLEQIIDAFRTSFWLEQKHWYVTCKYINNDTRSDIMCYSPADSSIDFPNNSFADIFSYSTSTTNKDSTFVTRNQWNLRVNPSAMFNAISSYRLNRPVRHICHYTTQMVLYIDWPRYPFNLLSSFVDCSKLNEIWLFLSDYHYFESDIMNNLLDLAYNVQTLGISYDDDSTVISEDILHSVISHHVKHLKIRTLNAKCIQLVLEYVKNLSSVTFVYDQASINSWADIIEWLTTRGKTFSRSKNHHSIQVWL
ncbi:hypothetical protein I4U23_010458 [Adineta vaga]|nr:hypothetical protein I4U23_010458 [Adineta vaga]